MRLVLCASCLVAALMAGGVPPCAAATLNVRPDGTGDFATIQAAIDGAAAGDTVQLADGTYTGAGNRELQFWGKPLTLRSANGDPSACVLDAQGDVEPHRAVWLHDLPTPGASLDGITFRNGYDDGAGGGVYVNGCRVVARHCVFRDNHGAHWFGGAGMAVENGEAELEDCLFEDNVAHSSGLPMAARAGGLCGLNSAITLVRCDFSSNSAGSSFDSGGTGGGMAITNCALTAIGCAFRGNVAVPGIMGPSRGGGLFVEDGTAELTDCLFVDNAAPSFGFGGALATFGAPSLTIANCTLQHNGGAGAIHMQGGTLSLARSIIAGNYGSGWEGEEPGVAFFVWEGDVTLSACDVFGHGGGDWVEPIADQRYLRGNFSADPCYCDAAGGDFHLCAASACAPAHNPWGQPVLVGAFDVGCAACGCSLPVGIDEARGPGAAPRTIVLHGVTPNPFNPLATIRFDILLGGRVRLEVYDVAGRLIRSLLDADLPAGSHHAVWDGRDSSGRSLASGAYFARLEAGGQIETVRMGLVR